MKTQCQIINVVRRLIQATLTSLALYSIGLNAVEVTPTFELTAKLKSRPSLCMTERKDRSCFMDVELIWKTNQANDFCIFDDKGSSAIACWHSKLEGDKTIAIHSDKDIHYRLVLNEKNLTVARAVVSIQSVSAGKTKSRRRRHAWSLF